MREVQQVIQTLSHQMMMNVVSYEPNLIIIVFVHYCSQTLMWVASHIKNHEISNIPIRDFTDNPIK